MKKLILALSALALSGCATQLSKQTVFDANNPDGLVVISINTPFTIQRLAFGRIDPDNCRIDRSISVASRNYDTSGDGDGFIIDTFEPGIWVVMSSADYRYKTVTVSPYNQGAIAFQVKAGEFTHIGKVMVAPFYSRIMEPNEAAMAEFIKSYPKITMKPTAVKTWVTPFTRSETINVKGCQASPLAD